MTDRMFTRVRIATARECLVDMADRDYLAARTCWRNNLMEHFLWNALQAIEKHLKAILLFNGRKAQNLGHNIELAFQRVLAIKDISFDFKPDFPEFVRFLNRNGQIRYFERPFFVRTEDLIRLDRAVWYLRRYCQDLRYRHPRIPMTDEAWLARSVKQVQSKIYQQRPHRFRLSGGLLEEVLDGRHGPELRKTLIWQNVFFGARWKPRITLPGRFKSAIPPHYRHPKVFAQLAAVLHFPNAVRHDLRSGGA